MYHFVEKRVKIWFKQNPFTMLPLSIHGLFALSLGVIGRLNSVICSSWEPFVLSFVINNGVFGTCVVLSRKG